MDKSNFDMNQVLTLLKNLDAKYANGFFSYRDLSDKELYGLRIKYKRAINELKTKARDTTAFEVEFCYIDREIQLRERYSTHSRNNRHRG